MQPGTLFRRHSLQSNASCVPALKRPAGPRSSAGRLRVVVTHQGGSAPLAAARCLKRALRRSPARPRLGSHVVMTQLAKTQSPAPPGPRQEAAYTQEREGLPGPGTELTQQKHEGWLEKSTVWILIWVYSILTKQKTCSPVKICLLFCGFDVFATWSRMGSAHGTWRAARSPLCFIGWNFDTAEFIQHIHSL